MLYMKQAQDYPNDPKIDEVYYSAAVDFERAKLLGSAIQAREMLLEGQARLAAGEEGDLSDRPQLPGRRRVRQGGRLLRAVRREVPRREGSAGRAQLGVVLPSRSRRQRQGDQGRRALRQGLRRAPRVRRQGGDGVDFDQGQIYEQQKDYGQAAEALPGLPEAVGRQGRRRSPDHRAREDRRDPVERSRARCRTAASTARASR